MSDLDKDAIKTAIQAEVVVLKHECPQRERIIRALSEGLGSHGPAFEGPPTFDKANGCWSVSNGEYASPVWHCPFCGTELLPNLDGQQRCEHDFKGSLIGFEYKACIRCNALNPSLARRP